MQRRTKAAIGGTAAIASLALVLAGCTAGDGGSPAPTDGGDSASTFTLPDSLRDPITGECTIEPAEGVDIAAAEAYIQPFLDPDKDIVANVLGFGPLESEIPPGLKIGYANNNTFVGDTLWRPFIEEATNLAGGEFINYPAGPDPTSASSGFDAILNDALAGNLDILIVGAISPRTVENQAKQLLEETDVAVVWGADPFAEEVLGVNDTIGGSGGSIVNGDVLAAAGVYYTCGAADNFTWYNVTELEFSTVNQNAAIAKLAELAPNATLRTVDGSITSQSATDLIIPDLQGHPDSQFFITPIDQFQIGIKDAAETADIQNWYGIGQSSTRPNVDQIVAGTQYGGYTLDFQQFLFQLVDEGIRKYLGEWPEAGYGNDWVLVNSSMSTLITQANVGDLDINADGTYTAVPDTVGKYAALWGK